MSKCVNAHDLCYGGAGGPCPYCEKDKEELLTEFLKASGNNKLSEQYTQEIPQSIIGWDGVNGIVTMSEDDFIERENDSLLLRCLFESGLMTVDRFDDAIRLFVDKHGDIDYEEVRKVFEYRCNNLC